MLAAELGLPIRSFAGPLKAMLLAAGIPEANINGADKEAPLEVLGGRSARYAMQTLGTEWGRRTICDDLWVRLWLANMPERGCICDDVRFINEARALKNSGGKLICIVRSTKDFAKSPTHPSENFSILPFHCVIENSDSKETLKRNLMEAVGPMLEAAL